MALALCLLLMEVEEGSAMTSTATEFCENGQILRDYLAPLSRLPQDRGLRDSGRLRVGPPALRIYPPRENLVRVGADSFAARGLLEGSSGSSRSLDWWVESRLERIDKTGGRAKLVKSKRQYIAVVGKFESRRFGFPASVAPGIYRLTLEIQNADGVKIDRYEEYYRAVKGRSDLRLATSFTSLVAGETGYLRVDNFGTIPAGYGAEYQLWNAQGEEMPVEEVFSNLLLGVKPGYASGCSSFKAPMGLAPGRYRIGLHAIEFASERPIRLFKWVEINASG